MRLRSSRNMLRSGCTPRCSNVRRQLSCVRRCEHEMFVLVSAHISRMCAVERDMLSIII